MVTKIEDIPHVFRYIWHLYLSMFSSRKDSMQSKQLANTFRIVQAFVCSVPLLLINFVTLVNALKVDTPESGESQADLHKLANHMGSGTKLTKLTRAHSVSNFCHHNCAPYIFKKLLFHLFDFIFFLYFVFFFLCYFQSKCTAWPLLFHFSI